MGKVMFRRLKQFFATPWIEDVQPSLAQCEFGCRAEECRHNKWEICQNRIRTRQLIESYVATTSSANEIGASPTTRVGLKRRFGFGFLLRRIGANRTGKRAADG